MGGFRCGRRALVRVGGVVSVVTAIVLGATGGEASHPSHELRVAQAGKGQRPSTGSTPGAVPPRTAQTPGPGRAADPHGGHGQAADWKPTWPAGDPGRGRQVFTLLECYACHEVRGEQFPVPSQPGKVGPELSQMGPLHTIEYFAEAIINPSGTVEKGKGYEAADGSSKMPSYNDVLTVQQLIDLVNYLRGLKPPAAGATAPPAHEGAGHGR